MYGMRACVNECSGGRLACRYNCCLPLAILKACCKNLYRLIRCTFENTAMVLLTLLIA